MEIRLVVTLGLGEEIGKRHKANFWKFQGISIWVKVTQAITYTKIIKL